MNCTQLYATPSAIYTKQKQTLTLLRSKQNKCEPPNVYRKSLRHVRSCLVSSSASTHTHTQSEHTHTRHVKQSKRGEFAID